MAIDTALLMLLIALLLLGIAIVWFFVLLRRSRVRALAGASAGKSPEDTDLASGVREAVAALRDKVPGGKFERRVPWILMIGEDAAGKTTVADHLSSGPNGLPVAGAGVRWSFLDGGVLVDVPGAFLVNPEGRARPDGRWNRFLRLLVRHRPARPIDGVVLTIPAAQLFYKGEADAVERKTVAAAIRDKLDEAQRVLGLAVPVYVLVTKCDQVRGFGSFCWEMNPDLEDDMFGWSNPNTLESAFTASWVDEAFDAIQEGILRQQMRVFGSRAATPGTDELFLFPLEFDAMRIPLRDFLTQIFRETSYVDSNFPRGIYFCGDSSTVMNRMARVWPAGIPPVGAASMPRGMALTSGGGGELTGGLAPSLAVVIPPRRQLVFAKHLFEFKVFLESKVARPVRHIGFTRNSSVRSLQGALLIFTVTVSIGMAVARVRLGRLRDHEFARIFEAVEKTGKSQTIPLQTAYDLVNTLGEINTNYFWSPFLPASWGDHINSDMKKGLAKVFETTLLGSMKDGLERQAEKLTCGPFDPVDSDNKQPALSFAELSFSHDPNYAALEQFLNQYAALERAIGDYDSIRRRGGGNYADLDSLFEFLLGKRLPDARKIDASPYYRQALSDAKDTAVPITVNGTLDGYAADRTNELVKTFYASWLTHNPLVNQTNGIDNEVKHLSFNPTNDELSSLAENIRGLDGELSSSNTKWLTQPNFDPSFYPALTRLLPGRRFAGPEFIKKVNADGEDALTGLRTTLAKNSILELHGTELHVSGPVIALEEGLEALLRQDFMSTAAGPGLSSGVVIWSTAALAQATEYRDSYDKFVRERLPLLPSDLRTVIQRVAARNLTAAVYSAVAHAQTPAPGDDDVTTLLAIRSFNEAVPLLTQLQRSLPVSHSVSGADLSTILQSECVSLARKLNSELDANPAYPYSEGGRRNWKAGTPLSNDFFAVGSPDELEEFLGSQRDRIHSLATEFAQPLAAYLQPRGLLHLSSFDRWAGIVRDVKDYDAKKPGNPIAAMETFIRTNLDRITPANACRATEPVTRGYDYFLEIRSEMQLSAVAECSETALQGYTADIAGFFNSRIAGKFPFGPLPAIPGAAVADPRDVGEFLSRIEQKGPALLNFTSQNPAYAAIAAFLRQSDGVRQMFAGGLSEGVPYADLAVYFRVNRPSEKAANEIIDWEFLSGDQTVHYPGAENGVRWHFGDPVSLTLRYAKDSPDIPQPGGSGPDARVDARTVSWNYPAGWSLFALLASHGGQTSDFGDTAAVLPGILRFVIPTIPDNSRIKGASPASPPGKTQLYIRLALRVPGAKEPRDVPVVFPFPVKAPLPPAGPGATE